MKLKVVGKSGQISLGKTKAGACFIIQSLPTGDILLKLVPENEKWLYEHDIKGKLARADEWMKNNPAKPTNLDELLAQCIESAPNADDHKFSE